MPTGGRRHELGDTCGSLGTDSPRIEATVASMLCGMAQSVTQIGIVALLGMIAFLPDTPRNSGEKLDWFGFGTLTSCLVLLV